MASSDSSTELLHQVIAWVQEARPLIPMYLHIILSVLIPIYTGAHASLSRPSSAAKPKKRSDQASLADDDVGNEDENEEEDEEETIQKMEGLSASDAIVFPITAGCVLAGLYYLITRYGAEMINQIMGWYFAVVGIFSVAKLINDASLLLESLVFPTFYRDAGRLWKVSGQRKVAASANANDDEKRTRRSPLAGCFGRLPLPGPVLSILWAIRGQSRQRFVVKAFVKDLIDVRAILTRLNVLSAALGIATIAYSVFVTTPWWLTNLQGFAVCYGALQLMSPTSFATGSLILTGLFFYDIWAVFFTPLMVTVAKNLDVPIKLIFPRPEEPSTTPGKPPVRSYSMIGLGDIVLPGIMIALALRFDLYMFYLRKQKKISQATSDGSDIHEKETVEKAPYVSPSRYWGDRIWTFGAAQSSLPIQLTGTFPKTYFITSMVGYVIGLITTLVVMNIWQHAQPALLYLVPGVLISLWSTALVRGELKYMWEFSEEVTGEQIDDTGAEDSKDQSSDSWINWLWWELFGISSLPGKKDEKSDSPNQTSSEKESSSSTPPTKSTKPEVDQNLVFSFTIQRRASAAVHRNADKTDSGKDRPSVNKTEASPQSSSAGVVLISSSDIKQSSSHDLRQRATNSNVS